MNKIHEVNVAGQYAVIEPGVTQQQLYDYLQEHSIPLKLNVTGSAAETSIIGNSLERGIGYFSSRADSLSGMEVVLGNGEVIRTGFAHFENSRGTYSYHHGVGPSLDGLFAQSNFGIVTTAGVELMAEPEARTVFVIRIEKEENLGQLVDALSDLLRSGVTDSVIHVGNQPRSRIAMGPLIYDYLVARGMPSAEAGEAAERYIREEGFGPWSALAGVMGTRQQVKLAKRRVRAAVRGIGNVMFLSESVIRCGKAVLGALRFLPGMRRKRAILAAVEALHDFSSCVPSSAAMQSVCWPVEKRTYSWPYEPDDTRSGMLYVVPFCPLEAGDVTEMVRHANEICDEFGFEPYITLNTVNPRCLEAVINIAFDRDDADRTKQARACNDAMLKRYIEAGMIPYRVGVQDMSVLVQESDPFWRTVRDLKTAVDPNHIISPGRYNLV
jgi:4-cresol dehydrogenase (hydroxylating)